MTNEELRIKINDIRNWYNNVGYGCSGMSNEQLMAFLLMSFELVLELRLKIEELEQTKADRTPFTL